MNFTVEGKVIPAENMAKDEAMLRKAEKDGAPPFQIRIYEWAGPAVSLSRSFRIESGAKSALESAGIAVVVRPTGGGVLVHGFDLSVSVAVPRRAGWEGRGIDEAGRLLAEPVLLALRDAGFEAGFRGGESDSTSRLCFLQKSALDIMVSGAKVGAFAQRRTARALFQHGSIQLEPLPGAVWGAVRDAGLGTEAEWGEVGGGLSNP